MPDNLDSRPPYQAIADLLRHRIASGEFSPGTRLPSGRELAAEYDVAPNTVLSAMRALRDEGLIVSQQGRGTFVRDGATELLRGDGSPEFKLLSEKLDAIAEALASLSDRVHDLEATVHPSRRGKAAGRPSGSTSSAT